MLLRSFSLHENDNFEKRSRVEVKPMSVENTDSRLRSIKKIIAPIQVSGVFYPYHMTYRNTGYTALNTIAILRTMTDG